MGNYLHNEVYLKYWREWWIFTNSVMSSGNVCRKEYCIEKNGSFYNRRRFKPAPQGCHRCESPCLAMLSRASGYLVEARSNHTERGLVATPDVIIWGTLKDHPTTSCQNTWSSTFRVRVWPPERPINVQVFCLGDVLHWCINSTPGRNKTSKLYHTLEK